MRRLGWWVVVGLLAHAVLTGGPGPVLAHALLLESSPHADAVLKESPPRIFLRFNSRLEKSLSRITLSGSGGRAIPLQVGASDPSPNHLVIRIPPLEPGEYLVRWKVLSADGHVTEGAFHFTLAAPEMTR